MNWKPRGLSLFTRDSAGGVVLAAWHSPHSLTWRWFVWFKRFRADESRVWPMWCGHRNPYSGHGWWGLRVPFVGFVDLHVQRPLWYRDMWISQDEQHRRELRERFNAGRLQGQRDVLDRRGETLQ